jgi:hypothetical protein
MFLFCKGYKKRRCKIFYVVYSKIEFVIGSI